MKGCAVLLTEPDAEDAAIFLAGLHTWLDVERNAGADFAGWAEQTAAQRLAMRLSMHGWLGSNL